MPSTQGHRIKAPLLLLILLWGSVELVRAQGISPYFGLGSAHDSAGTSGNQGCPKGQLFDGLICEKAPTMGGLFGTVGVDYLFKPHIGINAEYSAKFSPPNYLPGDSLNMRPIFYDVNFVWKPLGTRVAPFLEGGLGGAKISLFFTPAPSLTGIKTTSGFSAGSDTSHFQLHGAFGLRVYVRGHLFVRPELHLRYATHLTDEFGRNLVVQYTISAGYTFGQR
jgi:hypothetical protein